MPTINQNVTNANAFSSRRVGSTATGGITHTGVSTNYCAYTTSGPYYHWTGWRFPSISIPNAATITAATLNLQQHNQTGTAQNALYGDKVSSSGAWGTGNRVRNISKTSANLSNFTLSSGGPITANIATIVQEIVNQAGWASGNNLSLAAFPVAPFTSTHSAGIYSYAKGGGNIPNISITYSVVKNQQFFPCM